MGRDGRGVIGKEGGRLQMEYDAPLITSLALPCLLKTSFTFSFSFSSTAIFSKSPKGSTVDVFLMKPF